MNVANAAPATSSFDTASSAATHPQQADLLQHGDAFKTQYGDMFTKPSDALLNQGNGRSLICWLSSSLSPQLDHMEQQSCTRREKSGTSGWGQTVDLVPNVQLRSATSDKLFHQKTMTFFGKSKSTIVPTSCALKISSSSASFTRHGLCAWMYLRHSCAAPGNMHH